MEMDSPEIKRLKERVRAADEEFHTATAFHEAWKPMAYDEALHARLGNSYASNTFNVIRQALRREVLLALWRLWDNDNRAIDLGKIANTLENKRIIEVFCDACAAQWGGLRIYQDDRELSREENEKIAKAVRQHEIDFGQQQAQELRDRALKAIQIIRRYQENGDSAETLQTLEALRHQLLAHHDTTNRVGIPNPDTFDEKVETFYQDMAKLVQLLRLVVEGVSYEPEDTARIYRKNAAYFWASVKGERTMGHPDYEPPPSLDAC